MIPKSLRLSCFSTDSIQQWRACFTSRPRVLTNRGAVRTGSRNGAKDWERQETTRSHRTHCAAISVERWSDFTVADDSIENGSSRTEPLFPGVARVFWTPKSVGLPLPQHDRQVLVLEVHAVSPGSPNCVKWACQCRQSSGAAADVVRLHVIKARRPVGCQPFLQL